MPRLGCALLLALATLGEGQPAGAQARFRPQEGLSPNTYEQQLSIRLWGGVAKLEMFDTRVAIRDENSLMWSDGWTGEVNEGRLTRALAGGFEVSYGLYPDVKFLLALEGRGTSAQGVFEGVGPKMGQRVDRLSRYAVFGQEAGATVLLREFGWFRLGLTGRGGVHQLAGGVERGREDGPQNTHWWSRKLSGTAFGGLVGIEWEWLKPPKTFPLAGFILLGYRWLAFKRVSFNFSDANGIKLSGGYKNPDGRHRVFDFSGPEARFGLQVMIPFALPTFKVPARLY